MNSPGFSLSAETQTRARGRKLYSQHVHDFSEETKMPAQGDAGSQEKWLLDFQEDFLVSINQSKRSRVEGLLRKSRAQLHQDLFVLSSLDFPETGFFVELGATDGVWLSNSFLLEKSGWTGILSEPARIWHTPLQENRRCIIDNRAVWSSSGKTLIFKETKLPQLSTLSNSNPRDMHAEARENSLDYEVSTVSLTDLLDQHHAPKVIDFLSIDTEGSELEILKSFDFSRYSFKIVCLEHNYTSSREKLQLLMSSQGYERVLSPDTLFDDWFINIS